MVLEQEISFFIIRGILIIFSLICLIFLILMFERLSNLLDTPKKEQLSVIYLFGLIFYLSSLFTSSLNLYLISNISLILLTLTLIYYLIIIFRFSMDYSEINSNFKPLIGFILLGFITPLGIYFYIQKSKDLQQINYSSQSENLESITTQDPIEVQAQSYIEQYKKMYSKDSILNGLISAGLDSQTAKKYIEKYY